MNSRFLSNLNSPQKQAVEHESGPALVIAGAGSGKTRVLTHRVAYLVSQGIKPENILAITFTNKAAKEMAKRIGEIMGFSSTNRFFGGGFDRSPLPHVGTFHSIGARILRQEAEKIGYQKTFAIFDEEDREKLIRQIMKEKEINIDQFPIRRIQDFISQAKNRLLGPDYFIDQAENFFEEMAGKIYFDYQKNLKEQSAFDFDDLILVPVKLFQENENLRQNYQNQFRHILVDEYQDTNRAQYQFVQLLGQKHHNIFVVGDDFQGIYGWRGADIQNILSFEKDYPEAKVILLEQNYRSTQNILKAANEIIAKNEGQKKKKLWTENIAGEKIQLFYATDEKNEAEFIVQEVKKMREQNPAFSAKEVAILYRTNAQSRAIEEALLRSNISYHLVGALRFYARKEIKDVLAYFRLIANQFDEISLRRVYNTPKRGLGKKAWQLIKKIAQKEQKNVGELLLNQNLWEKVLSQNPTLVKWEKLKNELQQFQVILEENILSESLEKLLKITKYSDYLISEDESGEERLENIKELETVMKKYDLKGPAKQVLPQFLEEISLMSAEDKNPSDINHRINLMTLHSAKGLEFNHVFIAGMEEGIFPHNRSTLNPAEMEEERRLCYVGITRAKQKLFFTCAKTRRLFGNLQMNPASRFISEISPELLEKQEGGLQIETEIKLDIRVGKKSEVGEKIISSERWQDGDKVFHHIFGKGVIVSQDRNILIVAFAGTGIKKLDGTIAPLKKIDEKRPKKPVV